MLMPFYNPSDYVWRRVTPLPHASRDSREVWHAVNCVSYIRTLIPSKLNALRNLVLEITWSWNCTC